MVALSSLVTQMGWKRVGIVSSLTTYSISAVTILGSAFSTSGVEVVGAEVFRTDEEELGSYVTSLMKQGVTITILICHQTDAAKFFDSAYRAGFFDGKRQVSFIIELIDLFME